MAAVLGGARVEDAILAGMNPQHASALGSGAMPSDSVGYLWNAKYTIASGNLLADFRFNATADSQGRLHVSRLCNLTKDQGVKRMLAYMIARDTMHQDQWLSAIEELQADGLEETSVPSKFPQSLEDQSVSYQVWNCSGGTESSQGRWASGPTPDGKGQFEYLAGLRPMSDDQGHLNPADPRLHGTPPMPVPRSAHKQGPGSPRRLPVRTHCPAPAHLPRGAAGTPTQHPWCRTFPFRAGTCRPGVASPPPPTFVGPAIR